MSGSHTQNSGARLDLRGVLMATAALLTAGILLRAGGVGGEPIATAGMVGDSGTFTAMTARTGNQEVLYVIDDRSEHLLIYRVQNATDVRLEARQDLRSLFTTARSAYLGTAPGRGRP